MTTILLFHIVMFAFIYQGQGTVNFALHKSAVQSTTLNYSNFLWSADKAVDGKIDDGDPVKTMSCSASEQVDKANHTWEVEIGLNIIVKTITVYGRTDYSQGDDQLSGFNLYLGNNSRSWTYKHPLAVISSANNTHVCKPNNTVARFISVLRLSNILTICEVIVDGECIDGVFSEFTEFCNNTCGKCVYGQPCNKTDGTCPNGCDPGWKGSHCNEECDTGKYGQGCNKTCGNCLVGNENCSKVDGNCTGGCKAGYQGDSCKKACSTGKYSYNCNETCGNCLYGNSSCSTLDGHCFHGCQTGWRDDDCKRDSSQKVPQAEIETGILGGAFGGAVAVVVLIVVIVIIIIQRRRNMDPNLTDVQTIERDAYYVNLAVHRTDTISKNNVSEEGTNAYYNIEESNLPRGVAIHETGSCSQQQEADIMNNDYEQLRAANVTEDSKYSTLEYNQVDKRIYDADEGI